MTTEKKTDITACVLALLTDIPCFWYGAYWFAKIVNMLADSYGFKPVTIAQAAVFAMAVSLLKKHEDFELTMKWLATKWARVLVAPPIAWLFAWIAMQLF
jgi:hypothetical protein